MRQVHRAANASYLLSAGRSSVIVAPTGIFVIETRNAAGKTARGQVALDREALRQVRQAAEEVRELLVGHGIDASWVEAAICLPWASQERPRYRDDVLVARPWQLAYLVRHWRGQVLDAAEAERIFTVLHSCASSAAA